MVRKLVCKACGHHNFTSDVYCRKCNGALYERNEINEKKAKVSLISTNTAQ